MRAGGISALSYPLEKPLKPDNELLSVLRTSADAPNASQTTGTAKGCPGGIQARG
jgi:hypothetical protein